MTTRSRRTFLPSLAVFAALTACSAGKLTLPEGSTSTDDAGVGSPGNEGDSGSRSGNDSDASIAGQDAIAPSHDGGSGKGDAIVSIPVDSGPSAPMDAGAPVPSAYPSGPYGLDEGSVFPLVTLQGYKLAAGPWTSISSAAYYDPTGARGITGVFFIVGAEWCGACQSEADEAPLWFTQAYKTRGGIFASAIIEQAMDDGSGNYLPATQATVDTWIGAHKTNYDIMIDPHGEQTLPMSGSIGLPHNYVIDPRTMIIVDIEEGFDDGATPCTTDEDCSSGYSCSTVAQFCYASGTAGIIDMLDRTMIKNGATSIAK